MSKFERYENEYVCTVLGAANAIQDIVTEKNCGNICLNCFKIVFYHQDQIIMQLLNNHSVLGKNIVSVKILVQQMSQFHIFVHGYMSLHLCHIKG